MSALKEEQINSIIEKLDQLYKLSDLFTEKAASRIVSGVKELSEWKKAIKQQLATAGLPQTLDQIPHLRLDYTTPFPREFYMLNQVKTLRPEYLIGTWFNRQNRPFKFNMELDWVNRLGYGNDCFLPQTPMSISLFSSTGENIWDFISEVHVHGTAIQEFNRPRDGWIEAPRGAAQLWRGEAPDMPLNFIERMIDANGSQTIVVLKSGTGGWATFERVRNSEVTAAAAGLLFNFSDPLYCARGDGKVVMKLKDSVSRLTLRDMTKFPSGRTLVSYQNKFPLCIE